MKTAHINNVSGLRERPTYEELIDYIETNNDKIKMPDRRAKFIRSSFYLSQLDGEGMRQQDQMEQMREAMQDREMLVHQFARDYGFQYRDIDRWLQGRGLVPRRRSDTSSVAAPSSPGDDDDSLQSVGGDGLPSANVPALGEIGRGGYHA